MSRWRDFRREMATELLLLAYALAWVALIIAIYVSRRASLPAVTEGAETAQTTDRTGKRAESCPQETDGQIVRLKRECA